MRGEYEKTRAFRAKTKELPPRARRIRSCHETPLESLGTTSACAENTHYVASTNPRTWNYLRVRGEYPSGSARSIPIAELPPRARRIRVVSDVAGDILGTTSACAENTVCGGEPVRGFWNYLRVRGEYDQRGRGSMGVMELPPRARRILFVELFQPIAIGTTSACAENTLRHHLRGTPPRNYLRVRGEYIVPIILSVLTVELPPRARRIPQFSACLGRVQRNYLRVRGEYSNNV